MRYRVSVAVNMLYISFKSNYVPLFFEDGELMLKLRIREYTRNTIWLEKIPETEKGHAYVRPIKYTSPFSGVRLDLNVRGLDIEMPRFVSVEPVPRGLKLHINKDPDPGVEPRVTPVKIIRRYFRRPKMIAQKNVEKNRSIIRLFLMQKEVKKTIIDNNYNALSHVGGTMFIFNRNPLQYRSVYLPIIHKIYSGKNVIYTNLPHGVAASLGLTGKLLCFYIIKDIDNNLFLKLTKPYECERRE